MKQKLFTPEEIKTIDEKATQNISINNLIDEVGSALGEWFLKNISTTESLFIICGPGNNGNDGRALEKFLKKNGYLTKKVDLNNLELAKVEESIIIDAVFGISLDRELPEVLQEFILINQDKKVISIDVPSGVNARTGEIFGGSFKADTTLVVGALKVGLFLFPGRDRAGDIICVPVRSLAEHFNNFDSEYSSLDFDAIEYFPESSPLDHKYTKGVASFVMSEKYPGAAILAAKAAQASGCGYVKIFAPNSIIKESQLRYPDLVFEAYEHEKDITQKVLQDPKINSFCIGIGWDFNAVDLELLFRDFEKALIVDGGAMLPNVLRALKEKENVVFTPHSGEQKRAFGSSNKSEVMDQFYKDYLGALVLKGYDTLIGQKNKKKVVTLINSTKLSVAGTGDILAGLITGFMAQGLPAYDASLKAQRLQFLGAESSVQRMTAIDLIESIKRINI